MGPITLYDILQDIVLTLSTTHSNIRPLPTALDPDARLVDLDLNGDTLPAILSELKARLDGRGVHVFGVTGPQAIPSLTMKPFLKALITSIDNTVPDPIVVYVDDEDENIFIFKRHFGKHIRLVTFTDPEEAFGFIRKESEVRLVITDEVMPALSGTALCNAIHRIKPFLKFVLLTGNPSGDGDLMYRSLRNSKFHDFISKPLNIEKHGQEYLDIILSLVHGEAPISD